MSDTPALPYKPDNKSSNDANTSSCNAAPAEPLEKKSNGDAAPLPSITTKSGPKTVDKSKSWLLDPEMGNADETGTQEERTAFMKELESIYKDRSLEFKPPKFYGEPLNCLKACTTVSWRFCIFYEKALLEYEKYKRQNGEIQIPASLLPHTSGEKESSGYLASGSGRAHRDAAACTMQGWHAQRSVGYGEITKPIIKDKSLSSTTSVKNILKTLVCRSRRHQ